MVSLAHSLSEPDWSAFDLNSLLAGDSRGVVYLYDKRKACFCLVEPRELICYVQFSAESKDCYIRSFSGHTAAVTCLVRLKRAAPRADGW